MGLNPNQYQDRERNRPIGSYISITIPISNSKTDATRLQNKRQRILAFLRKNYPLNVANAAINKIFAFPQEQSTA